MSNEKQHLTEQEARAVLDSERQTRAAACLKEIEQALTKYNCRIVPIFHAREGQVVQQIEIVALDRSE